MTSVIDMASKPDLDNEVATMTATFNAALATKAAVATTYSKTEVDAKTASLSASIQSLDAELTAHEAKTSDASSSTPVHCTPAEKETWNAKADSTTTYSKSEVDAMVGAKAANADLTGGLALKADKVTTYTKTEVDSAVANAVSGLCSETTADAKIASAIGGVFDGAVNLRNDDDLYAAVKAILEKLGATVKE